MQPLEALALCMPAGSQLSHRPSWYPTLCRQLMLMQAPWAASALICESMHAEHLSSSSDGAHACRAAANAGTPLGSESV